MALTLPELMYMQWVCNETRQSTSGAINDQGKPYAGEIAQQLRAAFTTPIIVEDIIQFVDISPSNEVDMGTF